MTHAKGELSGVSESARVYRARRWRAIQLADAIDSFTVKEALYRATMPFEYVHRVKGRRLEREEEDKIWA